MIFLSLTRTQGLFDIEQCPKRENHHKHRESVKTHVLQVRGVLAIRVHICQDGILKLFA